jgi:hypothetical protein
VINNFLEIEKIINQLVYESVHAGCHSKTVIRLTTHLLSEIKKLYERIEYLEKMQEFIPDIE